MRCPDFSKAGKYKECTCNSKSVLFIEVYLISGIHTGGSIEQRCSVDNIVTNELIS